MTKSDLEQLSRQLAPDRFVSTLKLLVDEFPTSYFRILAAPRFKALQDFIFAQTTFCDEKPYGIATRVTCILNGKHDLFRCNCCGKAITHDISPVAYKPGQKFWCNSRCQADDPFLQKKLRSSIKKKHRAK